MKPRFWLTLFSFLLAWPINGQVYFGIYSKFEKGLDTVFFEPEAKVVSLYEGGVTYPLINDDLGWVIGLVTEYHFRYKILGNNPDNFGNISIPFLSAGDLKIEQILELKATVSYLDGEERKSMQLGEENIFKIDNDEGWSEYRIVFPQVKKGSILEWKYIKVDREFYLLEGWEFQGKYPRIKSEFAFQVPDFLRYQLVTQGVQVRENLQISPLKDEFHWKLENVPSFKLEPYIGSPLDFVLRVEGFLFQDGTRSQPIVYSTWEELGAQIQSIPAFEFYFKGNSLKKLGINQDLKGTDDFQTARNVYNFVKDKFKVEPSFQPLPSQDAKSLVKRGSGNHLDIHLILLNLLQEQGIYSDLVLINQKGANRSGLIPSPFLNQFSSSLIRINFKDSHIWLDATDPYLSFGLIAPQKLVDQGFLIKGKESNLIPIELNHHSGSSQKIGLERDSVGNWVYTIKSKLEGMSVLTFRDQMQNETPEDDESIEDNYDIVVIDNFQEEKTIESHSKKLAFKENEEVVVLSPFKESIFYENPFLEPRRVYPIDFEYPFYQSLEFDMKIPDGYELDEYPPSIEATTANQELTYRLDTRVENGRIFISSDLQVKVKNYSPRAYQNLKTFAEEVSESVQFPVILKKKLNK